MPHCMYSYVLEFIIAVLYLLISSLFFYTFLPSLLFIFVNKHTVIIITPYTLSVYFEYYEPLVTIYSILYIVIVAIMSFILCNIT
jgi:hypothetical protein